MASLRIHSKPLKGTVLAQPSKSMGHRAILCAALAKGRSIIDNIVLSDDMIATIGAVQALGVAVKITESAHFKGRKKLIIESSGQIKVQQPVIDCHESGSTARFIMPITRLCADRVTLTGRGRLVERPFELYEKLFKEKGMDYEDQCGKMPITISGRLKSGEYTLPGDVSSQFISGLLFALPLLEGDSDIHVTHKVESLPYIQMTLQALKDFGVLIDVNEDYRHYHIKGSQSYQARQDYVVEGDWSQAAFFCVMGALSEGLSIEGLNRDSLQGDKVIVQILERMGAKPVFTDRVLSFSKASLKGIEVDVSQCPDLVPAIGVAASLAEGQTHIVNAARLRMKESDRLAATRHELGCLGAKIMEEPEGLVIEGSTSLCGGHAQGVNDHRIVMALASATVACTGDVVIDGTEAVSKSYPEFWDDFKALGGEVEVL
ncbi:MAG: 3-phosphoshikimate 1-carboxyvinyltransferase [Clostridia bacterium]|nr:3-phosphoshikimate 1-carboxyvinyltransferase [Clostridia bacterium]